MNRLRGVRRNVIEKPDSFAERCRARRWEWFGSTFPQLGDMSVIDLGGTVQSWLRAPVRPGRVHLVNLQDSFTDTLPDWMSRDYGDACELPESILSGSYDVVFSNSVIEHVGGHERRQRFADAVHRLADRHWIQAPYRYFPLEPHFLFPGFQYLPLATRMHILRHWPLVTNTPADRRAAVLTALKVELPSRTEMKFYFPDSLIRAERVAGLAKSLIAIKAE